LSEFDDFLGIIQDELPNLGKELLGDLKDQGILDAKKFLEDTKDDLKRWSQLLAKGQLNQDEFNFLVRSQKDLFDLHSLKQAGLALITAQKFRDGVVDLVASAASKTFLA